MPILVYLGNIGMGGGIAVQAVVAEPYRLAPYVAPRRKLRLKKKPPFVEPAVIELTVSAPIQLTEPINYALEIDALSEAGRSVERALDNLDELRALVHKEAKRRKRRKRMLALITIQ
jgi:hypothetical protein